jgi:holin-like protein
MLPAIFALLSFELAGELLRGALHLAVPGPVLGMFLLGAWLAWRGRESAPQPTGLDRAAGAFLDYLGLLFVPAGVGIFAEADLLRHEWLPILGAVIGSTVLSLAATAFVMHRLGGEPVRSAETGGTLCLTKS